eukprot:TRINITY_DN8692_c1_g1_i1.p3 TRINITY_DN8692_c1_g1~~TRINITY_DN8692_c1_g1_i1.p3  ORF type:complete len:146 (+),score=70.53 TRINITY_DN8692_c1_g1_i1:58-438(+)
MPPKKQGSGKGLTEKPKKQKKEYEVRGRHILNTEQKIKDLYKVMDEQFFSKGVTMPPDTFSEFAKAASICPSAKTRHGKLPWFAKGKMEEAFEQMAFTLTPGSISEPFQGSHGWHILLIEEKREKQ